MADLTFKANLLPNTDLGKALGSENQRWNIYGKFAHTPNNTTTFLRGDNTFSNILTGNIYTKGYYMDQANPDSTETHKANIHLWGDVVAFTYRNSDNTYLGDAFYYNINNGDITAKHEVYITNGNLSVGTAEETTNQRRITLNSGSGDLILFSNASATGSRGLWVSAHGTGAGKNIILINTNNDASFAGNASSADKLKTARTLTIGGTGKNFDGSANVSWSKAEILGSSDTTKFYRGDQTWSNTLSGQMVATSFKINGNNTIYQAGGAELYGATPYIDFHFNNSTVDHTNRIIEDASGELKVAGKLKVATSTNWYALNAASFICDSWIRTKGASGWFNETYGGGWYMSDDTWIRSSHGKRVLCDNHLLISTQNPGNAYYEAGSALQIREVGWVGTAQSDWTYAPKIGFHWAGRVALQLGMDSGQNLRLYNNSSTTGGTFIAGKVYGAVWNDYAEMRNIPEAQKNLKTVVLVEEEEIIKDNTEEIPMAGRCVYEIGDDTMTLTTHRLQKGCKIISDTFGFNIGETENAHTPVAVSGRVLAYCLEGREIVKEHIGDPVCSGPNGTVSIMTEEEERNYPSRIIGTISAVPDYEEWGTGHVKVDGRIWIYVR